MLNTLHLPLFGSVLFYLVFELELVYVNHFPTWIKIISLSSFIQNTIEPVYIPSVAWDINVELQYMLFYLLVWFLNKHLTE